MRRKRFTLRSLLLIVIVFALLANHARVTIRQQRAVATVRHLGGSVHYDYEVDEQCGIDPSRRSCLPEQVVHLFGLDWAHSVAAVNLAYRTEGGRGIRNKDVTEDTVECIRGLPDLRVLVATQEQVTDNSMESIGRQKRLERLHLSNVRRVTDAGVAHLCGLSRLRSLHLTNAAISDRSVEFVCSLQQLKTLSLRGIPLSEGAFENLAQLQQLEALEIGMANCDLSPHALTELSRLSALRHLQIVSVRLSDDSVRSFAVLKQLKRLTLQDCNINDDEQLRELLPGCQIEVNSVHRSHTLSAP